MPARHNVVNIDDPFWGMLLILEKTRDVVCLKNLLTLRIKELYLLLCRWDVLRVQVPYLNEGKIFRLGKALASGAC